MIKVYKGTEIKLSVSIDPIDGKTMDDYNFEIELYVSGGNAVKKTKDECIRIDANNYVVTLDTNELNKVGKLILKITAYIPDDDFDDNLRTEISCIDTGVMIVKEL